MAKNFLLFILIVILVSCAGSQVTQVRGFIPPNMRIALAPSGGVLADAIGIELFNRGYSVVDTNQMSNLMLRLNMTELEILNPQNLERLAEQGIDVILVVKSVIGFDGKPQSASVRLNSTKTWEIIAGVSWQNSWGGRAGSIADRAMRQDLNGAAQEIVRALMKKKYG